MTHIRHHLTTAIRRHLTTALVAGALATATMVAPIQAETQEEWAIRALELQEHLDINQPLNRTFWVGTHNSYNAYSWDSFAYTWDANQYYSPTEQLEMGVRELTFDIYNTAVVGTTLRMCHGSCSGTEKKFNAGLKAIRDWINDGNEDSVVMLKLEIGDKKWAKIGSQIDSYLGDHVYKPREGEIAYNHASSSCYGLEPEHLTKADVLAEGKNVIVIVTRDNGCPGSSTFQEWVHVGFEYEENGGTFEEKFDKDKDFVGCEELYNAGRMSRIHDGNTYNNAIGLSDEEQVITEDNFRDYMNCGLNVFELFNFGDVRESGAGFADLTFYDALEAWDMVWSWDTDEPSGAADRHCARLQSDSGRFADTDCDSYSYNFACFSESTDTWKITTSSGVWSEGEAACAEEYPYSGYAFSVPHNAKQMNDLNETITNTVWVNYTDLVIEDSWVADSENIHTLSRLITFDALGSTSDGSPFDDFETASLLGNDSRRITNIAMRSGARIDALEVTYSDGSIEHHGGSGGGWGSDLSLEMGEHIDRVEICIDEHNGSDRVFYLDFETNQGNSLTGGTYSGECSTWQHSAYGVIAFHGRSGEELDALGFYYGYVSNITVIDNDDPDTLTIANGYVGDWPTSTNVSGYEGDNYAYAYGDNGTDFFVWSFTPSVSGFYNVYARWTAHSNRTTAEYTLLSDGQTLGTNAKDQTQDGGQDNLLWTEVYLEAGTSYDLWMNSTAGGYVVADSVTFELDY